MATALLCSFLKPFFVQGTGECGGALSKEAPSALQELYLQASALDPSEGSLGLHFTPFISFGVPFLESGTGAEPCPNGS